MNECIYAGILSLARSWVLVIHNAPSALLGSPSWAATEVRLGHFLKTSFIIKRFPLLTRINPIILSCCLYHLTQERAHPCLREPLNQVCSAAKSHLLSVDSQLLFLLSTWAYFTRDGRGHRAGEEESPKLGQILTRARCPAAAAASMAAAGPSLELQLAESLEKGAVERDLTARFKQMIYLHFTYTPLLQVLQVQWRNTLLRFLKQE